MSIKLRLASLAISAALVLPLAATAYADDGYGNDESVILQAARSVRPPSDKAQLARSHRASVWGTDSLQPMVGGRDVVGAGGKQDDLAREIYHPGQTVGVGGE